MAIRALDAYRDVRKELDKTESPSFSLRDFNYWINLTLSEYITENYAQLDILLKESDDIRKLVELASERTIANLTSTLPDNYRHILSMKVKMKFTEDVGKYKVNDFRYAYPERMKSGQKGFRNDNAYGRPTWRRPYYEIGGSTIRILISGPVTFAAGTNMWLDYIKNIDAIYINPADGADLSTEPNNTTIDLPLHVYYELIKRCRNNFLENIESPRAAFSEQLTKAKPE